MKINKLNLIFAEVIIFILAALLWISPTLFALHERWSSSAIEYSYFVVLLSAYLLYRRFRYESLVMSRGGPYWSLLFAGLVFVVFVCNIIGIVLIPQVLFPIVLLAVVGLAFGTQIARKAMLPLAFLYFSIPFWQAFEFVGVTGRPLNESLRLLTTYAVSGAISVTGIPALLQGDYISLPSGTFEIAEGCSGRAFFITALELSVFYALAFLNTWKNRVLLVGITCLLALLGNWIRVFLLIMIGYFTEMQHPLVVDHGNFGWVVFCFTTLPFIIFGRWLENREQRSPAAIMDRHVHHNDNGPHLWIRLSSALVIVILVFQFAVRISAGTGQPLDLAGPESMHDWSIVGKWPDDTRPKYPAAASEWSAWYSNGTESIGVFLADYPYQSQEQEAIHFGNDPIPGQETDSRSSVKIPSVGSTHELLFNALRSRINGKNRLTWVAYVVAGESAAGKLDAKLLQLKGVLAGRWDAQVYILTIECQNDCSSASERLRGFVVENRDVLFADKRRK